MNIEDGIIIDGKWKVEKTFEKSGQGQSALVSTEGDTENKYVIKVLKDKKNSTNVDRFIQEIELLEKLHGVERIPNIVDKNLSEYYYVMKYIKGPSLENAIQSKKNRRNFDKALSAIMQLLDIVDEYAKLKIIHRDIKPANIICKGEDIEDIYLIDFGIGHDCTNSKDLTEVNVQLGNRFLRLPELQNGNKRDIRSDITMCVGILFFLLTGSSPVSLLDENQKMPHQTEKGIVKLQWIGSEKLKILNAIFDKGFQNNIEERFQNVRDLIFALNEINLYKISEKSQKVYAKKTDSFCWATIEKILKSKNLNEERIMRKLKVYDGKSIAIGDSYFCEIDDKRFICWKKDNLFEVIDYFPNYYCEHIDGLFIRNNASSEEILMKQEDISEVFAHIHIKDNEVTFDNFTVQNLLYEIPVTRFLEPLFHYKLDDLVERVIYYNHKIIFMHKNSCSVFDFQKINIDKIDLSELFKESYKFVVSENLQWIVYCDDYINIAKLEAGHYIKKKESTICYLKNIRDFSFVENDLLMYISLFPQLIAGPIVRYADIEHQITERKHSCESIYIGTCRFSLGLGKKVLLANQIGTLWDTISVMNDLSILGAWLGVIAFALQIYFDFSAYSDMAIGLGQIFGFTFTENFRYPYQSQSITEFWRRWHITLGTWFREYVYIPLGGNRKGKGRQALNLLIVWSLTGLWHGADWQFLLWGIYYFLFLVLEKFFLLDRMKKWPFFCRHLYTIVVVIFGWLIFACEDRNTFTGLFKAMLGIGVPLTNPATMFQLRNYALLLPVLVVGTTELPRHILLYLQRRVSPKGFEKLTYAACIVITWVCIAFMVADTYNPFLYFRF